MLKQHTTQRQRLAIISLGFLFIATFLGLRLVQKQVLEHANYTALAKNQQYQHQEVLGKRGTILAKDGVTKKTYPLATNQTTYALNIVPSQVSDKRRVADELSPIVEIDSQVIFDQINNTKLYIPPIKHKLSYEEGQKVKALALEGVYLTPEEARFYPEDALAAQVLGFVNADGQGQYGIEGYFNDLLTPKSGLLGHPQDSRGQEIALGGASYVPPQDGDTVVLTIDRNVQFQAEEALDEAVKKFSASGGCLMVMEPKTGAIVAMASRPSFDPNRFGAFGVDTYTNQCVSSTYEPGSTFKPITMSSALDAGAVTPNTMFNGTASVKVSDKEIFNSQRKGYGPETMTQVIEHSDNVGMVFVSQQLGGAKMYDYIKRFGFGTPSGVELAGEITPPLAALDSLGPVSFATMSFGQGISVTPIQLLTAVNTFTNQGKLVQPHIVDQVQHKNGKVDQTETRVVRQVISPQAASYITGMMVRVVEAGAGQPAKVPGYRVAGKTGTAQIPQGGGYEPNATIGNFVGFAPVENPRFVMLVKVDRPKGVTFAEESAAPTFGRMAKFLLNYYNVPPG